MRRASAAFLSVAIGCQSVPVTLEPTECEARPSDFCAKAADGCPTGPTHEAFCEWLASRGTPDELFNRTGCEAGGVAGYRVGFAGEERMYLFDKDAGLAVVFVRSETSRCVAGPARLRPLECWIPGPAYGCVVDGDASEELTSYWNARDDRASASRGAPRGTP